ncbi:MAG: hypothetical protein P1U61_02725 [Legionellaceae bacterium]|nr:hypothetical protein [Legionellaceae bacterium]
MLSQQDAIKLRQQYQRLLLDFGYIVTHNETKIFRCDIQFIPNTLNALTAIAENKPLTNAYKLAINGRSEELHTDAQDCLLDVINYHITPEKHFHTMINHYLTDDEPKREQMHQFNDELRRLLTQTASSTHGLPESSIEPKQCNGNSEHLSFLATCLNYNFLDTAALLLMAIGAVITLLPLVITVPVPTVPLIGAGLFLTGLGIFNRQSFGFDTAETDAEEQTHTLASC